MSNGHHWVDAQLEMPSSLALVLFYPFYIAGSLLVAPHAEEARALLGKLEYQRGNVEGALRVFDGIDLHAAIQRMQHSLGEKQTSSKRVVDLAVNQYLLARRMLLTLCWRLFI